MNDSKREQADFSVTISVRLQRDITTSDGRLLTYVKENPVYLPKEMVLQALRERWLANVYLEEFDQGKIDATELRLLSERVRYALVAHVCDITNQVNLRMKENELPLLPSLIYAQCISLPVDKQASLSVWPEGTNEEVEESFQQGDFSHDSDIELEASRSLSTCLRDVTCAVGEEDLEEGWDDDALNSFK
jgi:hypothetical protein